jgi:hypothetical protein
MLSSFLGTDGGEVLDDLYKREAELEGDDRARKGGEKDVDPQGEDDDSMDFGIEMEDGECHDGNWNTVRAYGQKQIGPDRKECRES